MSATERQILNSAFGYAGMPAAPLLSCLPTRDFAAQSLIRMVGDVFKLHRPRRRWFSITLIDDRGNALEYVPAIDLEALREFFLSVLDQIGLDTFGLVEVQGLNNFPGKKLGRTLMFHAHVIGWTEDDRFDTDRVMKQLNGSGMLRNSFGARPVVIKPVRNQYRYVTWLPRYLTKVPRGGKHLHRCADSPSGYSLRKNEVRPDFAVRLMEVLTTLTFSDVAIATGAGVAFQREWLDGIAEWHRQHAGPYAVFNGAENVANVWATLHKHRARRRNVVMRQPFDLSAPLQDGQSSWELATRNRLVGCEPRPFPPRPRTCASNPQ